MGFHVWSGRFIRPLVTWTYYFSYHAFGLSTFPPHLALVLLHAFNAWLVALLMLRLEPPRPWIAASGAGLLFLLYGGHSEAVSWVAGIADPALVPFLIVPLLLLDRAVGDPKRWLPIGWIVGACGLLAKETAMILPALAAAYGFFVVPSGAARAPRYRATAIFVAGALAISGGYFVFRDYYFGSALGAYDVLGASRDRWISIARMLLIRLFVPPGRIAAYAWVHYLDVVLLSAAAVVIIALGRRYRSDRGPLAFVTTATIISLVPVLPFGVSLVSTISERYLYIASVFWSMLIVWIIVRIARPAIVAVVLLGLSSAVQTYYLARSNRMWVDVSQLFDGVVVGIERLARDHGALERSTIVLLNMPDAVERPFLGGGAALIALRLRTGEPAFQRARIVTMHEVPAAGRQAVNVHQDGGRFTVDVGPSTLSDGWVGPGDEFTLLERSPHRFTAFVRPGLRRVLVASWSGGDIRLVAELTGGLPAGSLDLPAADATCGGDTLRFAGWALDDEEGVEVRVEREDGRRPGSWILLGAVEWRSGTRPDVSAAYPGFASADRAEWNYWVRCTDPVAVPLPARIRVVARDRGGREVVLGSREVHAGR